GIIAGLCPGPAPQTPPLPQGRVGTPKGLHSADRHVRVILPQRRGMSLSAPLHCRIHTRQAHNVVRLPRGQYPPPPAAVGTAVRNGSVRTHVSSKPVVLIAEELSPATVDAL